MRWPAWAARGMSPPGDPDLRPGRVLVTEEELRSRLSELGGAIARDYAGQTPVLVGVLQGAFLFMADLIREIPIDLVTDFIGVSSYGTGTRASGAVRLVSDLALSIEGRHVVIVEDIVDTGLTLTYLKRTLEARRPRSLRVCVLADKIERREVDLALDYIGFTIPNVFVVGYGFDHAGYYRNLRHIAALEPSAGHGEGPAARVPPRARMNPA
jgi:hypoxanthine phosphoribosyltransferase